MLAPCLLALALLIRADLVLLVVLADVGLLLLAAADLFTLPAAKTFSVHREAARIASLRMSQKVTLQISNHGQRRRVVWIRDDVPEEFEPTPAEFAIRMEPRSRATIHYEFVAGRRGAFSLECVHLRVRSLLGLWKRQFRLPCQSVIHVYPDMKQLAEYAILARTNRLSQVGVRRTRRIGQDHEFERLRDYTPDDNYKHIDWRTTARRSKLTVKDFQSSQSQRILFLVDCGRMMTNQSSGISLLDHALNSLLMLSFVALRQGDSVGLICFSDEIHTFVPPRSGMNQMNQLLHASFDRFPRLVESRYDQAFLYLGSHCKKRSLVVLISNIIDEVNSHQLELYLSSLVGRHLPLGVLLRDRSLFQAADQPRPAGRQLFEAAAAAEILTWRHQVLTDLQHKGVLALDVFPEDMTAPLINRYLEIKARHLL
ncbi:MAG: DUF58 domain-containing protein [Pirellulaceae bacterium]|nr:DUF58 domain-containing protein [Pirellulaceae bacterium]